MNKITAIILAVLFSVSFFGQDRYRELAGIFEFDAEMAIVDDYYRYRDSRKGEPFIELLRKGEPGSGTIMVITESDIYGLCSVRIDRYIQDIEEYTNYSVMFYSVSKAVSPEDIKDMISTHYYDDEISGVVLIGDVSTAWYEIENDFYEYGYTLFPMDLFYMDIDGIWTDSDSNSLYDIHEGNVDPEIWVGRIYTGTMGQLGSEEYLLNLYFDRNHEYWLGNIPITGRTGLSYTDQDWSGGDDMKHDILLIYGIEGHESIEYGDGYFSKTDYLSRIGDDSYGMIQFACHSSWSAHYMTNQPLIYSQEIFNVPPESIAYNLFCCSGCRWTAPSENDYGYLGGAYAYADGSNTLFAVGSTKTGSMLGFSKYYFPLGQGKINGEALKEWWINFVGPTHDASEISWFYGMTIVGDPMIRLTDETSSHFQEGDGSVENPYRINDVNQLYFMRFYKDKSFIQNADIDLDVAFCNEGTGWWPIGDLYNPFMCNFDGNGYIIKNLMVNRPESAFNGLFGYVENSVLDNIVLKNASITGMLSTAGIAGFAIDSEISRCYVYDSSINGSSSVGGIAGNARYSTISESCSKADITAVFYRSGGLVGSSKQTIITDCFSTGDVSGSLYVGGLIGLADDSEIINCFSAGSVSGDSDTGGLIGLQGDIECTVTSSYWDVQVSGQTTSQGGLGRTTSEMTYPHAPNTYIGWDFENTWVPDISPCHNEGYPVLKYLLNYEISLDYFNASGTGQTASLSWRTLSENNISGFNLYRILGKKVSPFISFAPVLLNDTLIIPQGGTGIPAEYGFIDHVKPGGKFIYVLESVSDYDFTDKWRRLLIWE